MGRKFSALALVLLIWGACPTAAQDTEGLGTIVAPLEPKRGVGLPNQAPARTEIVVPSAKAATSKAAAPASTQPQPAAATETRFADWAMECLTSGKDAVPCQVVSRTLSADKKQVVMVVSMAYAAKRNETKFQMALPLGFSVQDGVTINLGEAYVGVVHVSRCTIQGCLVDGVAAPEMVEAMSKTKSGIVSIKTVDGNTVSLPFSLSGFKDAHKEMRRNNGAAPS